MRKGEETKILLVEDNNDVLAALRLLLEMDGFTVATARDGAEGYRAYLDRCPDLVITDLNMPSIDGLELITLIRTDRACSKTPIIVISAYQEGDRCKAAGANYYLGKPYDYDQLKQVIDYIMPDQPSGIAA